MKGTFAITFAVLLIVKIAGQAQTTANQTSPSQPATAAPAGQTQTTQTPDDAQRLTTGAITKIDAKKKILTVTTSTSNANPSQPQNTRRRNGGGMGGGMGRGGMGIPFPGGNGGGGSRPPTSSSKDQVKPFKVTINDQTAIKDNGNTISFGLLRVGDRISIQGLPKGSGSDLTATQITLNR